MAQVRGSLVVNASGDYIRRSTNLPSSTNFTMAGWVKPISLPGDTMALVAYNGTGWLAVWIDSSLKLISGNNINGSGTTYGSYQLSADTWYYVSISSEGDSTNDQVGYVWTADGTLRGTSLSIGTAITSGTTLEIGNDTGYSPVNGRLCYWRMWNAALSQSELEDEMFSETPVRTSNLDSALHNEDGTDLSGNGRNWTLNSISTSSDYPDVFDEEPAGEGPYEPILIPQPFPGALGVYRSIRGRIG